MEPVESGASSGTQTETVSAERAAAESGQFGAFQQAADERRQGKPPAAVTREKAPGSSTPGSKRAGVTGTPKPAAAAVTGREGVAAKGPSSQDKEADERLTARIREAVETSTAELRRKNEELERRLGERTGDGARKPAESEPAKRAALTSADLKKFAALPDAPKLDDKDAAGNFLYDTTSDHAIAMAEFVRGKRAEEQAESDRGTATIVERTKREAARVTSFAGRINAFREVHQDKLIDNGKGEKVALPLSDDLKRMHGYAKLAELNADRKKAGQAEMPATVDHAIAEEIYDSEVPAHVAIYLSEHPNELQALRGATTPAQLSRLFGRLEAKVIAADPTAAAAITGTAAAGSGPAAGDAKPSTKKQPADAKREAQAAVDRSVSSTRPLTGNLGQPGASGGGDAEERVVKSGDIAGFMEIERQKRVDLLEGRRGRAR